MPLTVLINGFGRIGRLTFRYLYEDPLFEIRGINDICSVDSAAYLGNYDSVHGRWSHKMTVDGSTISVDNTHNISFSSSSTIEDIPSISTYDVVLECTGKHLKVAGLNKYFELGVKRVIVSAPVKEEGAVNIVLGCNHDLIGDNRLVTNASCTTNCIAPVIKVMKEKLGIVHGCITTIHNVTGTQTLVDMPNTKKSDLRRARSGMLNLAPTSTGSATAVIEILPELKGKLNGLAIRVPLLNASITDVVLEVERETSVEEVNGLLKEASEEGVLVDIMGYEEEGLVSTDYTNDPRSTIVDALSTMIVDKTMVKMYLWYDNEMGYSKRMAELVNIVGSKLLKVEPGYLAKYV